MKRLRMNKKGAVIFRFKRRLLLKLMAVLLCLFSVLPYLLTAGFGTVAYAEDIVGSYGPTNDTIERESDPDTTDDYQKKLLSLDNGSRYAGRVWTDKSVFAYEDSNGGPNGSFDGHKTVTLDMTTDGYDGNVQFNADFLHEYSALASSQVVNEYPPSPIDLVIVFDMSGSMGQDTRYGIDPGNNNYQKATDITYPLGGVLMEERKLNSRIYKTLEAINETIDGLMKQNPQNRVAVCGYGANAIVIMPLAHYKRTDDGSPYLSVGGMETLYHPSDLVYREEGKDGPGWYWMNNRDTCYTVEVNAEKNNYTGILDDEGDAPSTSGSNEDDHWNSINRTISNNVLSSGTDKSDGVKAFPGIENQKEENSFNNKEKRVANIQIY